MLTSIVALGVGVVASVASPTVSRAEQVSLNGVPATAPSSLLMGAQ